MAPNIETSQLSAVAPAARELSEAIRACRKKAGLSQRDLAVHAGYTRAYINRAERPHQGLVSEPLVSAIDKVLGAEGELVALHGKASKERKEIRRQNARAKLKAESGAQSELALPTPGASQTETAPSRPVLDPVVADLCESILAYGDNFGEIVESDARSLTRDLDLTFSAYQGSRFTMAASRASALLGNVQQFMDGAQGEDRESAANLLALSYHAASSILVKFGHADLAMVAADRGFQIASQVESLPTRMALTRAVAFTLLANGRHESAMRLIDKSSGSLNGADLATGAGMSTSGTILLVGSLAAARFGDRARSDDYLREASVLAHRLGCDANFAWTAFGPTNVTIHQVNAAAELGDASAVIETARPRNLEAVPVERRVRYLLDVARSLLMAGYTGGAMNTLVAAERLAPEHVRRHYLSRKVAYDLAKKRIGSRSRELKALTTRMQLRGIHA